LDESVELSYVDGKTLLKYKNLEHLLPFEVFLGQGFVKALPLKLSGEFFAERDQELLTLVSESAMKECRINDRTFKLCSQSKEEYPVIVNGEKKFSEIPIRFAYNIEDKAPPASVDFKIEKVDGLTVALSWEDSVSPDVAGFKTYYAPESFTEPIGQFKTALRNESKPYISVNNVMSNKETLFKDNDRFYYAFDVSIRGKHFFGVSPFDFHDNVEQTLTSVSRDI
jgi:hypothetical protein